MFLHLTEGKRPTANQIIAQLQKKFADIPGLTVFLRVPPLITLGQNEGAQPILGGAGRCRDCEPDQVGAGAGAKLRTLPDLTDVYSDLRLASPRLDVVIDRDRALALGVSPDAIANTLYSAYGDRRIATITAATNEYDVILEVLPEDQRDPAALRSCTSRTLRTS